MLIEIEIDIRRKRESACLCVFVDGEREIEVGGIRNWLDEQRVRTDIQMRARTRTAPA